MTLFKRSRGRRAETIKFTVNTQFLVSLIKPIFNVLLTTMNPSNKLKATPNAVDLAMDLILFRSAETGEKQPITNLKPWISANTTGTSEKVKICIVFLLNFMWFSRNDLVSSPAMFNPGAACGPVWVLAAVKVSYMLTTNSCFDNLDCGIFDAGGAQYHFNTSVTIAVRIRTHSVH